MPTNPTDVVSPGFTVNAVTPIVLSFDPIRGENGAPGTPGAGIKWQEAWQTGVTYQPNDAVSRNGASYIAIVQNTSIDPATDNGSVWGVLSSPGQPGPPGPTGLVFRGAWVSTVTYAKNDLVTQTGQSYIAVAPSTGVNPGLDTTFAYWAIFAASGSGGDMYKSTYVVGGGSGNANKVDHAQFADAAPWAGITGKPVVGDMTKAVYDANNDGIVNQAAAVPWAGVTGRPVSYPPSAHESSHLPSGSDPLPLASPASAGLIKAVSGLTTDFLDGTGSCQNFAAAVPSGPVVSTTSRGLLKPISGLATDFVDGTGTCKNLVNAAIPSGTLLDFAGANAPAGFLLCDGSAYSRTTYAALFAILGTTWGPGDGSTTFNVPDLRSRVSVGAGQGGTLSLRTLGAIGGEEAHKLVVAEMPSHSHGQVLVQSGTTGYTAGGGPLAVGASGNTGGSGSHNTMPPFAVVTKIIKT
jgi:microcystin-dependent protein